MRIEFFTDDDGVHNARFPGDAYASNEAIFGIFYDHSSEDEAKFLFEDIDRVRAGAIDETEFGDSIEGVLDSEFATLRAVDVESKVYRLRTLDLRRAVEKWLKFRKKNGPNLSESFDIDADIIG